MHITYLLIYQGYAFIWKCCLTSIEFPIMKARWSHEYVIVIMPYQNYEITWKKHLLPSRKYFSRFILPYHFNFSAWLQIYVSVNIGSGNGLSVRCRPISWIKVNLLWSGPWRINFSSILFLHKSVDENVFKVWTIYIYRVYVKGGSFSIPWSLISQAACLVWQVKSNDRGI